jgi:hypothetical protein
MEPTPALVRLVVSADPGTEVFVIDHAFRPRARGLGGVKADVRPGLYKIKYKTGSLIREEHQVVPPGPSPVRVVAPPMPFTSVVPLRGTGKSYEAHEVAAQNLSREVHLRRGQGSELFVFVRRWSSTDPPRLEDQDAPPNPAQGLSLHHLSGDLVADLEQVAGGGTGPLAYAGCTVALDPAAYRLRLQSPNWGALEQIVVASRGWQTQLFLPALAQGNRDVPADLPRTAMLHAPLGRGFVPAGDDLYLTELARIALANQRTALTPQDLTRMLDGKFENPMLGIYGAHALLMADDPDRELLLQAVDNLTKLLGDHPDVAALRLAAGDDLRRRTFPTPPMLLSSWRVVLKAAIEAPAMVPARSLAARVSPHLWGSGPWLIWQGDALEEEEEEVAGVGGAAAMSTIRQIASDLPPEREASSDLTDVEAALLTYAVQAQRREGPTPASDLGPGPGGPPPLEKQMAQALGVPPAEVNIIAGRVVSKLAGTAEADDEGDHAEPDG